MDQTSQIRSLAAASEGNYPQIVEAAITSGASPDQFFADLITAENREPVLVASGLQLSAGEVLFQTLTAAAVAGGSNAGNGVLTVANVGLDAVIGVYTAVCVSARTNRGIFELRNPDGDVVERVNVGTPFASRVLNFTIADGSSDFAVGDSFAITVTGSSTYAAYDFAADPAPPQVATAVLGADIDTVSGSAEQFATARGPAILSAGSLKIIRPDDLDNGIYLGVFKNAALQLARRGIVLRGAAWFLT